MGLGLPVNASGGDFKPIVKYDARAGRIHRIDRDNGVSNAVEITQSFTAIFDLKNIEVGYALFSAGGAPQWAMVRIGQTLPAKPSKDFKQGFRVMIKLAKSLGGDVREFASVAGCVIAAMDQLFDTYSKAPEFAAGKLPVVSIASTTMVKSGSGDKTSTNYAPNFVITAWVDRPSELPLSPVAPANMQAPLTPASAVPPPIQQPAPAQTGAIATEF